MAITMHTDWFYGNEVSNYGKENGYVDYRTLAKAFDAVLNNNIINATGWENWDKVSGMVDNSDEIEELREQAEELEDTITLDTDDDYDMETIKKVQEIEDQIAELEREQEESEIFQYYIVSDNGAEILKEADEIVFYNEELDMYVWGVTHYGTAWDYVLTNIKIEKED